MTGRWSEAARASRLVCARTEWITLGREIHTRSKRNAGSISPNDLLTLVVIGGMGTDAIMGGSTSVGDILLMILIVFFWAYLLDKVEYHFPAAGKILREKQTVLIDEGRLIRRNMRREMVTEEELMAVLRKEGIDDPAKVQAACLEADGEISVVPKGGAR